VARSQYRGRDRPKAARAAAERTTAFYTGGPVPSGVVP
jgi:hypothetical protein